MAIGLGLINDNSIEQTLSAHSLDERALKSHQTLSEHVAELLCTLNHLLLADDLKGANSNGASKWVTTVG